MFGWFKKKKPKTAFDVFVEAIYGENPPKLSANFEQSAKTAYSVLLNGKAELKVVRAECAELYSSGIPYNTYDLALSTALKFYMNFKEEYNLDFTDQLQARMAMLEWIQEKKCNPIIANTFEDKLYNIYKEPLYKPSNEPKKQTPKEIFDDIINGKNTTFFKIGSRAFPHAPRTQDELNEVIGFIVKDLWGLIPTYEHLYQFVMCEIEGASMSDNETAQQLVQMSGFPPSEYKNALIGSELMDEDDSATHFLNAEIFLDLLAHFNRQEVVFIRCLIMMSFINEYREQIDEARNIFS
ncbi:hypothetical protein G5C01_07990 [Moraxella bovoculi]|uniref:hypothetical protein n=1 Tax=Moraxella bovoculi TaxID=386891 RepID=UPI00156DC8BB|nr:hypothetical protein [Moraxella bovoculi]NSM11288.1 hypothetical protein [Moraxella bovoculi]